MKIDDQQQLEKWKEFQNAAVLLLHQEALRLTDLTCAFQYCKTPTVGLCTYWSVFKDHRKTPGEHGRCFAINGAWDKGADLERFVELWNKQSPDLYKLRPAVEHRIARLKLESMESFLADLNGVRVPPFCTDSPIGPDGIGYAFSLKHNFLTADFSWWEAGPAEWRPMIECVQSFAAWLDSQPRTELKK